MAFTPPNGPKRLPDGREVIGTITAAARLGVTPQHLPSIAQKHGLTRYASRNDKNVLAYYWLVEEIEAVKVKRDNIVADVAPGEFIEAPFEAKAN